MALLSAMATGALEDGIVVRVGVAGGAHVVGIAVIGRERRVLRVVEGGARPGRRVVTVLARRREELRLRRVSRVRRVVVIGLVAADAGRRQRRVVVVDVAVGAHPRRHRVRAGQGERRGVVVKRGVRPDRRVMAQFAGGREAGRGVRRIGRAGVILLVARVAQTCCSGCSCC